MPSNHNPSTCKFCQAMPRTTAEMKTALAQMARPQEIPILKPGEFRVATIEDLRAEAREHIESNRDLERAINRNIWWSRGVAVLFLACFALQVGAWLS